MAIPVVRFKSLDKEFNIPVTSISKSDPAQIINSGSNDISNLTSDILSAISAISRSLNLAQDLNAIVSLKNRAENALGINRLFNTINSVERSFRSAKGIVKSTINSDLLFAKNINNIISKVFNSDPALQNIIKTLNLDNKNRLVGNVTIGKPYKPITRLPTGSMPPPGTTLPISIGDSDHNYNNIIQVISKLSNNNYNNVPVDKNTLVQQMVMLGNLGYEANLPGVMKALNNINEVTPDVLMRATSIVMVEQSTAGNSSAIIDMSMGDNSVIVNNNAPLHQAPAILSDTFNNFKKPPGSVSNKFSDLVDNVNSTAYALDNNWNVSDYDGTPSIKHFPNVSPDLKEIMLAKVNDNIFDEDHLDITFSNDLQNLYCAITAVDPLITMAFNNITNNQGNCCIRPSLMCC